MNRLAIKLRFKVNEKVFLRDPDTTDLGRKIIECSILLIDEIGFESFTFKKLAAKMKSTEASVYRYFENKHKLLIYLLSWYWNWLEYLLVFSTNNISSPQERLKIGIGIIANPVSKEDPTFQHINEISLHSIVISESSKAFLTKEVDNDNKEGYFMGFKSLCLRFVQIIKEINPKYPYAASMASTIIEGAHQQKFFAQHLPSLTDAKSKDENTIPDYLTRLVFNALAK